MIFWAMPALGWVRDGLRVAWPRQLAILAGLVAVWATEWLGFLPWCTQHDGDIDGSVITEFWKGATGAI